MDNNLKCTRRYCKLTPANQVDFIDKFQNTKYFFINKIAKLFSNKP